MGQKTNPNILQVTKTNNYCSNYIEKKSTEFYLHTAKDLEIRKFIYKFFKNNNLIIHTCKINYLNNNLDIYIKYYQNKSSLLLINKLNKTQNIKFKKKIFSNENYKLNYNNIIKSIKKLNTFENLKYTKKLIQNKNFKKFFILKRIKILKYYKMYLNLTKHKTIKNIVTNDFLSNLFHSLVTFNKNLTKITLIIKPLNTILKNKINNSSKKFFLKKKLLKLKKFRHDKFFRDGINLLYLSILNKNSADLISNYIALNFKKTKKHTHFLRFIKTILTLFLNKRFNKLIKGIKIKIKGRINGAPRAKRKMINIGKNMSILKLDSNIDYSESTAYTANGTIGIKVWICQQNKKNKE